MRISQDNYLGVYWVPRDDSLEQCAQSLKSFMHSISGIHEVYGRWIHLDRGSIVLGAESSLEAFEIILSEGAIKTDFGTPEELIGAGCSISLWNGRQDESESAGMAVACGQSISMVGMVNAVTLDMPGVVADVADQDFTRRMLVSALDSWKPDWGWIGSYGAEDIEGYDDTAVGGPFVSPMFFLNRAVFSISRRIKNTKGVSVRETEDGWIIEVDPVAYKSIQKIRSMISRIALLTSIRL